MQASVDPVTDSPYKTMRRVLFGLLFVSSSVPAANPFPPARPKIYGIAFVRFKAVDLQKSSAFYSNVLGLASGYDDCPGVSNPCFVVNPSQHVELTPAGSSAAGSFLDEVAFSTNDLAGMRSYLVSHQFSPTSIAPGANGLPFFEVVDPEHNRIAFVKRSLGSDVPHPAQVSQYLFHAGWVVRNLEVERKFYCGLLGFRLYWYGGFKDTDTDWFEIQVPDGNNWVEFMLNIPANAGHRELGVQNHFSLGVPDIKAAEAKLRANGFSKADKPEVGRDGKWSFDIYDPDGNRVEFMEPGNAHKPCCHPYTAPHPKL
jgi:catechol 2,3-dioxygenase-like lactoylglutathione lyase family enzyme